MRVVYIKVVLAVCIFVVITSCTDSQSTFEGQVLEVVDMNAEEEEDIFELVNPVDADPDPVIDDFEFIEPIDAYLDFVNADESLSIIYFAIEDLDHDGHDEAVLALGHSPEHVTEVYVMRNRNGVIESIGDNVELSDYGVSEVRIISMQGQKYIFYSLTDGVNIRGVKILEVSGDALIEVEKIEVVSTPEEYDASEKPLVAAIPEKNIYLFSNKDGNVILYWDDVASEFEWSFMTPRFILPRIIASDFDGDGSEELAAILHVGSGTGVAVDDIYVLERDDAEIIAHQFSSDDYYHQLNEVVGFEAINSEDELNIQVSFDGKSYLVTLEGYTASENGGIDDVFFGPITYFKYEDGKLKAQFGVAFSTEQYKFHPNYFGKIHANLSYSSGEFTLNYLEFEEYQ